MTTRSFKKFAGIAAALMASGGLAACAATQPLKDISAESIRQQVKPGDAVQLSVADGRTFDLAVEKVEATTLTGTTAEGKRFRINHSAINSLAIPGRRMAWFGANLGLLIGDAAVPCQGGAGPDCSESGILPSIGINVTAAGGPAIVRLRAVQANEDTGKPPTEVAVLAGPRLSEGWSILVGANKVYDADDEFVGDDTGLAWEILYAPRGSGIEFSLHGGGNDDVNYNRFSIGARFGKVD